MAVKPKKGKAVDKWRKKKYFSILAPKLFQERELGQTIAYEPDSLKGRSITCNLMMLTGNIKKQHINVTFKVNKVQGDTAFTMVEKYEVVPAALKRKVRRQRDRLDESFQCVTKDNKLIVIKPLAITRSKTSKPVKSALRKSLMQSIINSIRKIDYDTLVMDVINENFQKNLAHSISKIFPIRFVDIRVMKYLGEQKGVEASAGKAEEKIGEKAEETKEPEEKKKSEVKKPEKKAEEAEIKIEAAEPEAGPKKPAAEEAAEKPGEKKEVAEKPEELAEESKPAEA